MYQSNLVKLHLYWSMIDLRGGGRTVSEGVSAVGGICIYAARITAAS
jgi:hypothetical protein